MARRINRRPIDPNETADRKRFLRWLGDDRLEDAARALNRPTSFLSLWLRHACEVRDEEIEHWVSVTGIPRRTFLDGRYESRVRGRDAAA